MNHRAIRRGAVLGSLMIATLAFAGCSVVAETGRRQFKLFPESYMNSMGLEAYSSATSEYPEITSGRDYEMLQRVGRRIAEASGREYEWEFKLLDAPTTVNAFALPGGKVACYTGILRVTQNEDALAAVIGHEVAHATAQHGNERMTQSMVASGVTTLAELALANWGNMTETDRESWMSALGMGAQIGVLLPFSREHESEADEIGLRYLIRAGYDPWEAPKLWERMAELSGPERQPELTSTHPDPLKRAARLRELIPQFLESEAK